MEPQPRRLNLLQRIRTAREQVLLNPQVRHNTETDIARGQTAIDVLDRYVLPHLGHPVNILLVGIGLQERPFHICYEPFTIAAHLEGKGANTFTMTLVDIDEKPLQDVSTRTKLYLDPALVRYPGTYQNVWQQYLIDTVQQQQLASVEIVSQLTGKHDAQDTLLVAHVSPLFRSKLAAGDIALIQADIATVELDESQQFDFADCTNVLYLLSGAAQEAAIANIIDALHIGGYLVINDLVRHGIPVTAHLHGWLKGDVLKDFGLEEVEVLYGDQESKTILYRKVA